MSYLDPPPMPAPVVVMKDVGGIVKDYQAQTEYYRRSGREVRLHECRSACTLALSLPNVCVYPDAVVKFHQAYNLRSRATDFGVSQQLFDAYPPAIKARLGTLTRDYRALTGTELIALGIRNCNDRHIMLAAKTPMPSPPAAPQPLGLSATLSGSWTTVVAALTPADAKEPGQPGEAGRTMRAHGFSPESLSGEMLTPEAAGIDTPLPRPRPIRKQEAAAPVTTARNDVVQSVSRSDAGEGYYAFRQPVELVASTHVIAGAQPILPARFVAYVEIAKLTR